MTDLTDERRDHERIWLEPDCEDNTVLRSIVQTYSEAHEAAVRQGVQMRDRMEEVR